jgi:hypothetical protein
MKLGVYLTGTTRIEAGVEPGISFCMHAEGLLSVSDVMSNL